MFKLMAQHYGERAQVVTTHKRRYEAERMLLQQGEILKGYHKRTMMFEGAFIVIEKDEEGDYYQTKLWISK